MSLQLEAEDEDFVPQLVERFPPSSQFCDLKKRIPITILTGFLGAGKSTLLNSILSRKNLNTKFAVIMNEFGDTAEIEKAVSLQGAGEDSVEEWLELPNGCLCCTIKTTAMQAIESLLKRKSGSIDYILLETTGLADPYPIINSFWADEALECMAYLDGVLCLVDAKNIVGLMEELPVLKQQIIMADAILINKIDLISHESIELKGIKKMVLELNPLARTFTSQYGQCEEVDILKLLDIKAYGAVDCSFSNHQESYLNLMRSLSLKPAQSHMAAITSIRLTTRRSIDRAKFEKWLFGLLWQEDGASFEIFRGKGLLRDVQDGEGRRRDLLIQAVKDLYDMTELTIPYGRNESENNESVLVLLGRFEEGDEEFIRKSFYSI